VDLDAVEAEREEVRHEREGEPLGAALLEAARAAFIRGMHLTSAIAAVVALAVAILAVTLLRHIEPNGAAQHDRPDRPPAAAPRIDHHPGPALEQAAD
jgi:hypothetical protein